MEGAFARGRSSAASAKAAGYAGTARGPVVCRPRAARAPGHAYDEETLAIEEALDEHGPTERRELAELVAHATGDRASSRTPT